MCIGVPAVSSESMPVCGIVSRRHHCSDASGNVCACRMPLRHNIRVATFCRFACLPPLRVVSADMDLGFPCQLEGLDMVPSPLCCYALATLPLVSRLCFWLPAAGCCSARASARLRPSRRAFVEPLGTNVSPTCVVNVVGGYFRSPLPSGELPYAFGPPCVNNPVDVPAPPIRTCSGVLCSTFSLRQHTRFNFSRSLAIPCIPELR